MANSSSLTYGQLYTKLKEHGFDERLVELDGNRGRVFKRSDLAGSMIVIPERDPDAPVEPFDLNGVLFTLKRLGLLPEPDPLAALEEWKANGSGS